MTHRPRTDALRRWKRARDRGSTTIETAVLFPVFLLLLLSVVQAGVWWHARTITLAAARAGVDAGRRLNATDENARRAAESYLDLTGPDAVTRPAINTSGSTRTTVVVTVTGTAPRVLPIPGLAFHIRQSATAARERFTTPQE